MKRCYLGIGLLLVLLLSSCLVTWAMDAIHSPIAEHLALAAQSEDPGLAAELAARAQRDWERWDCFRRCFSDHTPVEDIDVLFAVLGVQSGGEEFASTAAEAAQRVLAIADAHRFSLGTFF